MIAVLRYGALLVPASLLLAVFVPGGAIFRIAGVLGIPAAVFASAVLFKAWKERNSAFAA